MYVKINHADDSKNEKIDYGNKYIFKQGRKYPKQFYTSLDKTKRI
jgi:hypothetical protein